MEIIIPTREIDRAELRKEWIVLLIDHTKTCPVCLLEDRKKCDFTKTAAFFVARLKR